MKLFIRSLTDYCSHQSLRGKWIDISEVESGDEIREKIQAYLKERTTASGELHEEFAIHEYSEEDYGEYPDLDELAQVINISREYDINPSVVKGFIDHGCDIGIFSDCFEVISDSEEEFAEEFIKRNFNLELLQSRHQDDTIHNPTDYLDYERIARDIFINDFFSVENNGKIAVFKIIRCRDLVAR